MRFGGGSATSGFIPGMKGKGGGGTDTLICEVKGTFDDCMANNGLFGISFSTEDPRVPNLIDAISFFILSYLVCFEIRNKRIISRFSTVPDKHSQTYQYS